MYFVCKKKKIVYLLRYWNYCSCIFFKSPTASHHCLFFIVKDFATSTKKNRTLANWPEFNDTIKNCIPSEIKHQIYCLSSSFSFSPVSVPFQFERYDDEERQIGIRLRAIQLTLPLCGRARHPPQIRDRGVSFSRAYTQTLSVSTSLYPQRSIDPLEALKSVAVYTHHVKSGCDVLFLFDRMRCGLIWRTSIDFTNNNNFFA